jgi:hypothetical protein
MKRKELRYPLFELLPNWKEQARIESPEIKEARPRIPVVNREDGLGRFRVTLSTEQLAFAMSIGGKRDSSKGDSKKTRTWGKRTRFGTHYTGILGELMFIEVYGGTMDTTIRSTGDGHKPDVTLPDGRLVEVKTSTWEGLDVELKIEPHLLKCSQYYSLVQLRLPDKGIVYPIWSLDFLKTKLKTKNYGNGDMLAWCPNKP